MRDLKDKPALPVVAVAVIAGAVLYLVPARPIATAVNSLCGSAAASFARLMGVGVAIDGPTLYVQGSGLLMKDDPLAMATIGAFLVAAAVGFAVSRVHRYRLLLLPFAAALLGIWKIVVTILLLRSHRVTGNLVLGVGWTLLSAVVLALVVSWHFSPPLPQDVGTAPDAPLAPRRNNES